MHTCTEWDRAGESIYSVCHKNDTCTQYHISVLADNNCLNYKKLMMMIKKGQHTINVQYLYYCIHVVLSVQCELVSTMSKGDLS